MGLERRISLFTSVLVLGLLVCICVTVGGTILKYEEARLGRDLQAVQKLYSELESERFRALAVETKLLADLPQLRAVVSTRDGASITDTLEGFRGLIHADLVEAYDESGKPFSEKNRTAHARLIERARSEGRLVAAYVLDGEVLRQSVAVPVANGPQTLGLLVASYTFGDEVLGRLQAMTRGAFAVVAGEGAATHVLLATKEAREALGRESVAVGRFGAEPLVQGEFIGASQLLGRESGARLVSLRALDEGMQIARRLRWNVIVLSMIFCFLGIAVSLLFARSISRPLRSLAERLGAADPADPESLRRVTEAPERLGADRDVQSVLTSFSQLVRALGSSRDRTDDSALQRTQTLEARLEAAQAQAARLAEANDRLLQLVASDDSERSAA